MSKYIKLLDIKFAINDLVNGGFKTVGWGDSLLKICSNYAIDIVHCRDCKHYVTDFGALMICEVYDTPKLDSDFCSWGERDERIEK